MLGYTMLEHAVVERLTRHFTDLSETRCKAGDPDAVFTAIFQEGADTGCFLEFNGGREDSRRPFNKPVWIWSMAGVFVLRYGEEVESKLRSVIDRLAYVFLEDHTLGGLTPRVRVLEIGDAEPGQVNDIPFYWLPFIIEAIDRMEILFD